MADKQPLEKKDKEYGREKVETLGEGWGKDKVSKKDC